VTFFFGFCGLIAGWSGLVNLDNPDEINAAFFAILKPSNSAALFTVVVLIAVVLSEAAVDSFQNAILSSIISLCLSFGFKVPVWAARTLVVVFNVPLMIIGTQGFPIVSLYLITNMLTTCCFIPLIIGLYKRFDNIVNQGTVLFGCAFALVSVLVLGTIVYGSFVSGVQQYFFSPNYQWSAFVCAPVSSVVGMALYAFVETKILRKRTASPPMELPSNE
jgi:hypothetical protein